MQFRGSRRAARAGVLAALLTLMALTLASVLLGSGPAGASVRAADPSPSSSASVYPPPTCSALSADRTVLAPGESLTLTGTGFEKNVEVSFVMHPGGAVLGHATSDGAGDFVVTLAIPAGTLGNFLVDAVGGTLPGCPVDPTISLQVTAGAGGASGGVDGDSTSAASGAGTATTGVDIAAGLVLASALFGAGVLLVRGGRRSKRHAGHAYR
ncbi:hypothetical protein [Jatrophihabitans sp.]|uniref:hypothetical protein n=1 Tax=Jatrophihabitans sp. TaxID=1932789 RepID=UPI0030C74DE7|nr:hypothetical protein [Jatrophihabitans sp.]